MSSRTKVLLLVALTRIAAFPFSQNVAGDSVVRTWLGLDWANAPHWVLSWNDGVAQYGPLHIVLLGLASLVWPNPLHVGRAVSLAFGIATAWPLMAVARRQFGERAELASGLSFALWSLHVQCSTMAASEALCLFFVVSACASISKGFETGALGDFALAGLFTTLGCAVRYDVWLWTPLVGLLILHRTRRIRAIAVYAFVAATFPVLWLIGNAIHAGDALAPIHDIDDFHRRWYLSEVAFWGPLKFRAMVLGFWPSVALVALSPPIALVALRGVFNALKDRNSWWLVGLLVLPPLPYLVRALLLSSFVPLARFTVKELAVLCLFVGPGLATLSPRLTRWVFPLAATWAVALVAFTQLDHGNFGESLVPVSAIARNPYKVAAAIDVLQRETRDTTEGVLVLDADPSSYDELQLKFYGGLPRSRVANARAADFEYVLSTGRARWVARFTNGQLAFEDVDPLHIRYRGVVYELAAATDQPVRIYRRVD